MAVKCFPLVGEPMLDTEWQQIFKALYKGVATGLEVTADGGGLRVYVSAGEGGVAGHGIKLTTQEELAIESTGSARTARVVLDPVAPHVKVRYSAPTATQYLLANVAVSANAVTIAPSDVTNVSKNVMAELAGALNISLDQVTGTLGIGKGGTGATTASGARSNLGLGTGALRNISGNITYGTANPTGGSVGDIYFKVV